MFYYAQVFSFLLMTQLVRQQGPGLGGLTSLLPHAPQKGVLWASTVESLAGCFPFLFSQKQRKQAGVSIMKVPTSFRRKMCIKYYTMVVGVYPTQGCLLSGRNDTCRTQALKMAMVALVPKTGVGRCRESRWHQKPIPEQSRKKRWAANHRTIVLNAYISLWGRLYSLGHRYEQGGIVIMIFHGCS